VAEATENFTGSELEKVVQMALRRAFAQGREVETADLLTVTGETVPLVTTMQEQIQAMRQWATRARPASSRQETGRKVQATGRALEV